MANKFTDLRKWVQYNNDFYCGCNVSVFFGGIWVDDIVTMQYTSAQSKVPLYGYASQQFDAVAQGQFLIQGNFTIAFKETGYLHLILERVKTKHLNPKLDKILSDKRKKEWDNLRTEPSKWDQGQLDQNVSPLTGWTYAEDGTRLPIISTVTIEQSLSQGPGELGFEDMAENLEDSIWGVDSEEKGWDLKNAIPRPDQHDLAVDPETFEPIDSIDPDGFNILIAYGNLNSGPAEHTVQSLVGVHITDVSQVLMPNGDPIAEQYSFFARGLNESIGSMATFQEEKKKAAASAKKTETIPEIGNKVEAAALIATIDVADKDVNTIQQSFDIDLICSEKVGVFEMEADAFSDLDYKSINYLLGTYTTEIDKTGGTWVPDSWTFEWRENHDLPMGKLKPRIEDPQWVAKMEKAKNYLQGKLPKMIKKALAKFKEKSGKSGIDYTSKEYEPITKIRKDIRLRLNLEIFNKSNGEDHREHVIAGARFHTDVLKAL